MAYAATVTIDDRRLASGRRRVAIKVAETEVAATSEWSTVASATNTVVVNGATKGTGERWDAPVSCELRHLQAQLVSGAAATIQPRLGKKSAWSDDTADAIDGVAVAAAYHSEGTVLPFTMDPGSTASRALYGRSTPSSGTDGVVTTYLTLVEQG